MHLPELCLLNMACVAGLFGLVWLVSIVLKDVSIVDAFWSLGFVLIAWISLICCGNYTLRGLAVVTIVTIWGLRLAGYLGWRKWGTPEDRRYTVMRDYHGNRFPVVSLFTVFGLQGLLICIISLPIQVGVAGQQTSHVLLAIGAILSLIGVIFESVGDYQLARFKSEPSNEGKVMDKGLWRYTRHPNYFGDFLVWWGIFLAAADSLSWWWTIISPLLMSFLLLRVSGVTLLERSLKNRIDGYEAYVRNTSSFFPLPPKRTQQK